MWGKLFFPEKPQAGILHTGDLRKTRRLRYQLALSQETEARLKKSKDARVIRIESVQNGLNRDTLTALAKADHIRKEAPRDSRVLRVGFLGRFAHAKGVDLLIAAVGELKRQGVFLELVLGGAGELDYREEIERAGLNGNVRFLGWINDAVDFYAGIDIFCLPSRVEPFGMILIEAMASRLPVIATRASGPVEIIESGKSGFLIPLDDVNALVVGLRHLATHPVLRDRLACSGQDAVLARYSPEAVGRSFENAFIRFGISYKAVKNFI